jgi:NAD(P)-dependent dehydrogenase (short-subunit alcohol dehydrogenase family)
MQFHDSTVIVTGGSGGLGRAICEAFRKAGAYVISADIAAPVSGGDDGMRHRPLDVADERSWEALFDAIAGEGRTPDVLINNAGFYQPNVRFEDMSIELWHKHFRINADGVFLGCKHAIRRMKPAGRGAIVNMASGLAITASATGAAYCASKAAVAMTTRTAAASAGPYGIRVNAVLPGAIPTTMLMGNLVEGEDEAAFLDRMRSGAALGRLATPEDVARTVLFLADPANGAISGVLLPVDGGAMPGA